MLKTSRNRSPSPSSSPTSPSPVASTICDSLESGLSAVAVMSAASPSLPQTGICLSNSDLGSQASHVEESEAPLFLSIDLDTRKMRACIMDRMHSVLWVDQVSFDHDLVNYGHHMFTSCPSELKLAALDLLLLRILQTGPPGVLGRIQSVSGSTPSPSAHFLSSKFGDTLSDLAQHSREPLTSVFESAAVFSLSTPPTIHDLASAPQAREIEINIGLCCTQESPDSSTETIDSPSGTKTVRVMRKVGREHFRQQTGLAALRPEHLPPLLRSLHLRDISLGWSGAHSREETVNGEPQSAADTNDEDSDSSHSIDEAEPLLSRTTNIMLEGQLLASIFTGSICRMNQSSAATTGLFDLQTGQWSQIILSAIFARADGVLDEKSPVARLEECLGNVTEDEGEALGAISEYFVSRFGFDPECLVSSFLPSQSATYLAYAFHEDSPDVVISLGVDGSDALLTSAPIYSPGQLWDMTPNPTRSSGRDAWCLVIWTKEACLARSWARDLYCNSNWDVFSRLVALTPHGGSIGLDDKCFSFFLSDSDPEYDDDEVQSGFARFWGGVRQADYIDRKINPRLLVESQHMSLRVRYASWLLESRYEPNDESLQRPYSGHRIGQGLSLGFDPFSSTLTPSRLILAGGAASNPAMISLLSTIFDAPAYFLNETTELATTVLQPSHAIAAHEGNDASRAIREPKTTSSALGSAKYAAWVYDTWKQCGRNRTEHADAQPGAAMNSAPGRGRTFRQYVDDVRREREDALGKLEGSQHDERQDYGLTLVAEPDRIEHSFYNSMLPEFKRLESLAKRAFI